MGSPIVAAPSDGCTEGGGGTLPSSHDVAAGAFCEWCGARARAAAARSPAASIPGHPPSRPARRLPSQKERRRSLNQADFVFFSPSRLRGVPARRGGRARGGGCPARAMDCRARLCSAFSVGVLMAHARFFLSLSVLCDTSAESSRAHARACALDRFLGTHPCFSVARRLRSVTARSTSAGVVRGGGARRRRVGQVACPSMMPLPWRPQHTRRPRYTVTQRRRPFLTAADSRCGATRART